MVMAEPKTAILAVDGERMSRARRALELLAPGSDDTTQRCGFGGEMDLACPKGDGPVPESEKQDSEAPTYPCELSKSPRIILDRGCDSMYYLGFPRKLAQDMVLIRIQKICRETESNSDGRIYIDNSCIERGRITIQVNLAEPDDGGEMFRQAVDDIVRVLCTTTNLNQRANFLSDLERFDQKSQR